VEFSLEGFSDSSANFRSTTYAIEGITDSIKNAFNKIKEFMSHWVESIVIWFKNLFIAISGLVSKLKKLNERVESCENSTPSSHEIEISGARYDHLFYEKDFDYKGEGLLKTAQFADTLRINAKDVYDGMKGYSGDIKDHIEEVGYSGIDYKVIEAVRDRATLNSQPFIGNKKMEITLRMVWWGSTVSVKGIKCHDYTLKKVQPVKSLSKSELQHFIKNCLSAAELTLKNKNKLFN
jgi:hypothetical protein